MNSLRSRWDILDKPESDSQRNLQSVDTEKSLSRKYDCQLMNKKDKASQIAGETIIGTCLADQRSGVLEGPSWTGLRADSSAKEESGDT